MKFYKTKWFLLLAAVVATVLFIKYVMPKINMKKAVVLPVPTPATTANPVVGAPAPSLSGAVRYSN